jgi:purine-binding chemotaxis protein CheW
MEPTIEPTRHSPDAGGVSDLERSWLAFEVSGVSLALVPSLADEICDLGAITPIPLSPRYVEGIVSVRGRPIPLVSLAAFAGLPAVKPRAKDERPERCIVATAAGMTVAIRCDEVRGVLIASGVVRAQTVALPAGLGPFVKGEVELVGDLFLVLDFPAFVDSARLRA